MPSALDQQLFLWLNADRGCAALDMFWAAVSSLDFWFPFFVVAGLLVAWRGGFRARAMLVCIALSIGIMEAGVINPLKKAFGRPRPHQTLIEARFVDLAPARPRLLALGAPPNVRKAEIAPSPAKGKSFPSAHTWNMFAFATIVTAFYKFRGAWLYAVAALVALSRVATGSHWPSDVLFSAVLSVVFTLGLLAAYGWIWRRVGPRILPGLAARHPRLFCTSCAGA
ncbi:MAG: phosphatase PAP2 family protein [Chthoniobacterales bacterium]|nr:phosphatase PAP2 family protein [Chthoniobacterales bacterium]